MNLKAYKQIPLVKKSKEAQVLARKSIVMFCYVSNNYPVLYYFTIFHLILTSNLSESDVFKYDSDHSAHIKNMITFNK